MAVRTLKPSLPQRQLDKEDEDLIYIINKRATFPQLCRVQNARQISNGWIPSVLRLSSGSRRAQNHISRNLKRHFPAALHSITAEMGLLLLNVVGEATVDCLFCDRFPGS